MDSLRSLLGSPELLFAVTLTAKTCAAAGAGFILFAPLLALLFSRRSAFWVRALSFVVTLPLVRGQILAGLLLGISRASGEVGITMMIGGNISGKTNTLSLEIFNAVSRADFDAATALCLLLSAFTLIIFAVLDRLQRRAQAL